MNQTVESRKYYPTALALYITYFVLGVAATIMGQYKQNFAALWGAAALADGSYDVSGVVAVIAAIGLGRLVAFPVAGPLSDRLGRRLSALIGCGLYAIFLLGITFAPNLYVGYALAVVSGMANSFLDTSITPSCMEIFKEKGTIANIFTKLSISIAQFLLPFAIGFVAAHALPFRTIFISTAVIIIADGILLAFLPFPPFEKVVKVKGQKKEKMHFTPAAIVLVCLGFTTSTTFMLWMNCNQELGTLYGLADPSKIQSFYSVGIVVALFVSAALLKRNVEPAKILVIYPSVALATLAAIYFIQKPVMCLAGGFLLGFFAAAGDGGGQRDVPQEPGRHHLHRDDLLQRGQLHRRQRGRCADPCRRRQRPPAGGAVQHGGDAGGHPAGGVPEHLPEVGARRAGAVT